MPRDACLRTTPQSRLGEEWSVEADLLALSIEVASITASGRQLRKPITLPRPGDKSKPQAPQSPAGRTDDAFKRGISVLAASAKGVAR